MGLYLGKQGQIVQAVKWEPGVKHPDVHEKRFGQDIIGMVDLGGDNIVMVNKGDWVVTGDGKVQILSPEEFAGKYEENK